LQPPARPFKRAQRLRKRSEFDRVYRDARRFTDNLFTVLVRANDGPHARLGLAISTRAAGNSVRRNRLKRLIRESFRQHQHLLPPVDIVVNARAGVRAAENAAIAKSLEKHWHTVIKKCAAS